MALQRLLWAIALGVDDSTEPGGNTPSSFSPEFAGTMGRGSPAPTATMHPTSASRDGEARRACLGFRIAATRVVSRCGLPIAMALGAPSRREIWESSTRTPAYSEARILSAATVIEGEVIEVSDGVG